MNAPSAPTTPASPPASNAVSPGWRTSEFWMTLFGHAGLAAATLSGILPPKYAAMAAAASQVAYNLSRALVKSSAAATAS